MSAHTPGPWGCTDTSHHAHDYRLTRPDGEPLPLRVVANDHTEQRANARLIAAAPGLLAALADVVETFDRRNVPIDAYLRRNYESLRAAIARARGEP